MVTKQKSGRGRPRKFDVDKAIAQAMDLFQQRGYDGVGIAELSKKIGITAPSLYSAFGSKRKLFERVLERYVKTKGVWFSEALEQGDSLPESISVLLLQAAQVYSADPKRLGCLVIDGTRNCGDMGACELAAAMRRATWDSVRSRIKREEPRLQLEQIDVLADYVVMILVGLSGSARDGAPVEALQASAEIAAIGFNQRLQQYAESVRC